ncbi:MAG: hypothetical protein M1833_007104 [Piccolia ochrophora]|nr:MAG: hypothetical protein M1833_007104 [Piccolia ochrophora]
MPSNYEVLNQHDSSGSDSGAQPPNTEAAELLRILGHQVNDEGDDEYEVLWGTSCLWVDARELEDFQDAINAYHRQTGTRPGQRLNNKSPPRDTREHKRLRLTKRGDKSKRELPHNKYHAFVQDRTPEARPSPAVREDSPPVATSERSHQSISSDSLDSSDSSDGGDEPKEQSPTSSRPPPAHSGGDQQRPSRESGEWDFVAGGRSPISSIEYKYHIPSDDSPSDGSDEIQTSHRRKQSKHHSGPGGPVPISSSRRIRDIIEDRLSRLDGPPITVCNDIDLSSPPLDFTFISESILREGVTRFPEETMAGCDCRVNNGRDIGCEYVKNCSCLDGMRPENRKFPYLATGEGRGTLRPGYLETRDAIFECNKNCGCGPKCKNKVVQWGRHVPLEIFKTAHRGWGQSSSPSPASPTYPPSHKLTIPGLRCPVDLRQGEFVDTYKGEILTEKACRRRDLARRVKDVYTFALDKFHADNAANEWVRANRYVVDGETLGGPTRFINHSCAPNLRQFTVSYNHSDPCIYDLAFFAIRPIKAGTELTFDYVDKDVDGGLVGASKLGEKGMTRCLCGSRNCKGFLWI